MLRASLRRGAAVFAVAVMLQGCSGNQDAAKQEFLRSGDQYFEAKDFNAAIVQYRNAIEQDEFFGEARYKLAQTYAAMNAWDRARREFVRAADLMPDDAEVQAAAARALLRSGEFQDARARAERALSLNPKHVDAHIVRGSAAAGLRDFEGALEAIEEGIATSPDQSELHVSLATLQAVQGRREEAEAAFKQALVFDPQSVPVRLALANYYWANQQMPAAEGILKEALGLDANSVPANRALASLYLATNRRAEAEAPLKRAAESNETAKLVLADYYVSLARYDEAQRVLDGLSNEPRALAAVAGRRAGIEYQQGRRDAAHATLDAALAQEPKNVQLLLLKGGWLLQERNLDAALSAATSAVDADAQSWRAHELLGSVYAARRSSEDAVKVLAEAIRLNPRAHKSHLLLAELNVEQGRAEAAVRYAQEAVQVAPAHGLARYTLVRALLANNNVVRARTEVQPLLVAGQKSPRVQSLLGQILMRESKLDEARAAFNRAAALDPKSDEALAGLVAIENATKQPSQAVQRVESYLKGVPESAQRAYLAARTYSGAGDMQRAEESARRAIQLDPAHMEAYHLLARLFIQQRRLDEAQREYERIAQQRPNDVSAHTMVALIYQAQNKQAEAKKAYEKILSIDGRAVVAANNLAYLHAEDGSNLDVALNLAQVAKAARPDHPDVNDTLGWVYYKRDLPSLAIDPLEQSVKADSRNPVYQLHLGLAYWKAGDKGKARAALQRAMELDPNVEGAAEARKALAELR